MVIKVLISISVSLFLVLEPRVKRHPLFCVQLDVPAGSPCRLNTPKLQTPTLQFHISRPVFCGKIAFCHHFSRKKLCPIEQRIRKIPTFAPTTRIVGNAEVRPMNVSGTARQQSQIAEDVGNLILRIFDLP